MGHNDRMTTQSLRAANMIRVRMTVDDVCDWFIRYFRYRLRKMRDQSLRNIYDHDTAVVNKEHRLNRVVRNHIETATEILETISFGGIDRRSLR